ncbi:glycosyl transferase [Pseudorhizobium halotolerans]|uniref:Glycosyl transferase n=1 Tax=Pseudorhizobium halotolerans TaxID=1233081 RepID=A0ABN7JPC0_9HYPH|nr:glycosyltransferase family 2 protein [Pseudorhizobium halotolerans]CAD7040227.1 glycosyl transferase [Pseudorhizobium halotolerans]
MRLGEYSQAPSLRGGDAGHDGRVPETAAQRDLDAAPAPAGEAAALQSLGFSKPLVEAIAAKARNHGTSLEQELLHHPGIEENAYYGAMARFLRLPFLERIDSAIVVDSEHADTQLRRPTMIRLQHQRQAPQMAVIPRAARLGDLAATLAHRPSLREGLVVTTPTALRAAVWEAGALRRIRHTVGELFDQRQDLSARIVLMGGQGFVAGLLTATLVACALTAPGLFFSSLHPALSYLYLLGLILRIMALLHHRQRHETQVRDVTGPLPCYTILVALYREAAIARQLVDGLKRIDWPSPLLDIKLVCEADDRETIDALRAQTLPANFEIVEVPPAAPRTKPKALSYALNGVSGDFLVIYDAEDRPHPGQLREAYSRFCELPAEVVCLQAPLVISNAKASWISALFALEYSALFRALLPWLASHRMPIPLGGTSNHFRVAALREVGGWDPFNVTEDADLGLRLFRLGYRANVLQRPTQEDAPTTRAVWMGQRTRWFKGWVQTWLVLMRQPGRLVAQMGLRNVLIFQLLIGGMLLSSLLHPLIFVFLVEGAFAMLAAPAEDIPARVLMLFVVDAVNIFGSYLIFVTLGIKAMTDDEQRQVGMRWTGVPLYWLLTSIASWKAVMELRAKPFFWQKTPHQPSS